MLQRIRKALTQLDFTLPMSDSLLGCLDDPHLPPWLSVFLNAVHRASKGHGAELMSWLFYRPNDRNSIAFYDLICFMESEFISLQGLRLEGDIAGCFVLPVADFSGAHQLHLHRPLEAHYLFQTQNKITLSSPIFSFSYLDSLACECLAADTRNIHQQQIVSPPSAPVLHFIKTSLQHPAGSRQNGLSMKEKIILTDHLVILVRLTQFLRQKALQPNRLYHFLLDRILRGQTPYSLDALYQEFCTRQNPLQAYLLPLQERITRPMEVQWNRYRASSWYSMGKIAHLLLLCMVLGGACYMQVMPSLMLLLPLAALSLWYCGISLPQSGQILTPFIKMPLQWMLSGYLANELVEHQYWGVQRETHSVALSVASLLILVDIGIHGKTAHQRTKERHAYLQAANPISTFPRLLPFKEAGRAILYRSLQYGSWMFFPYVSMDILFRLLHSVHCTDLFQMHWPTVLHRTQLVLSILAGGYHYDKMRRASHPVTVAFQKKKSFHFGIEAIFSLFSLMISPAVGEKNSAEWLSQLAVASSTLPLFTRSLRGSVNGFSSWYFLFLSQVAPDAQWVNTPSAEFSTLLQSPRTSAAWYATPWSISQGMVAHLAKGWNVREFSSTLSSGETLYFDQRQCPSDVLSGIHQLLGPACLGVLRVLSQSDGLLKAQGIDHPTALFLSTLPVENLDLAENAVHYYPTAITHFFQFMVRSVSVELTSEPRIAIKEGF